MLADQREGPVEIEPIPLSSFGAWLMLLPLAAWWSWVLFSFARAQVFMASCEICVSPNLRETREAFKAEGISRSDQLDLRLHRLSQSMTSLPS